MSVIAIIALAVKTGRGVSIAGHWIRGIIVDAMTEVVKDHAPSVEQVTEIVAAKTAPLHAELTMNGGRSLKDQVTRIEQSQKDLRQRVDDHLVWSREEADRVLERLQKTEQDAREERL